MEKNLGALDRLVRIAGGVLLVILELLWFLSFFDIWMGLPRVVDFIAAILALYLIVTGSMGYCPLWVRAGLRTNSSPSPTVFGMAYWVFGMIVGFVALVVGVLLWAYTPLFECHDGIGCIVLIIPGLIILFAPLIGGIIGAIVGHIVGRNKRA